MGYRKATEATVLYIVGYMIYVGLSWWSTAASLQQHPDEACWVWTNYIFCAPAFVKVGTVYHGAALALTENSPYATGREK
jgi:predicted membrane channel-forming protein YqfA (hemolysin III family)